MINKFLIILFIVSLNLVYLTFIYNRLNAKINSLEKEKAVCEQNQAKNQIPEIGLNDIFLYGQKSKSVAVSSPGRMYFNFQKTPVSENLWQIEIRLEGNTESLTDAADLELNYENDMTVIDVATGDAFPLYPRKIITDKSVTITGVSTISQNKVTFGRAGRTFTIVMIKVKPNSNSKHFLRLNSSSTKIYFSGQDILDTEKNINQIEI